MSNELKISKIQFDELISKLDTLIKLTATSAFQGKPLIESTSFLLKLGLKPKEIAIILGTKPNIVRALKSKLTKKSKKKQKTEEEPEEGKAEQQ